MALESASFISGLNASNPLSTDTVSQADDHIRLIKAVLKNTFPNVSGPVTATQAQLNVPIPVGFIGMWSGSVAAIPTGWALCNGLNGTPDLRDRFIVGAGSSYAPGATGGADTVTLTEAQIPSHTHTITSEGELGTAGAHTHSITDPGHRHDIATKTRAVYDETGGGNAYGQDSATGNGPDLETKVKTTGISIQSAGDHTHSLEITSSASNTGGGQSHENRPPYYALAYIMKT